MNKVFIIVLTILITMIQEPLTAQESLDQLWFNYTLKVKTDTKFSYGGDVGIRGFLSDRDRYRVLFRPSGSYKFNETYGAAFAIAIFHTNYSSTLNTTEYRIHQDFNIEWLKTKWFSMFGRVRIEERFFTYQNANIPSEFRVRGRLLLGIQSQDINWFGSKRPIYFQSIYEGFLTFGRDDTELFINQGRFHLALGHRLSKNWKYEIHFIKQKSRLIEETSFNLNQEILRLRLFHTINMKKSKPIIPEINEGRVDDFN